MDTDPGAMKFTKMNLSHFPTSNPDSGLLKNDFVPTVPKFALNLFLHLGNFLLNF